MDTILLQNWEEMEHKVLNQEWIEKCISALKSLKRTKNLLQLYSKSFPAFKLAMIDQSQ